MTINAVSRRGFLGRASVLGAAAAGAPALLSACESIGNGDGSSVLAAARKNGYLNVGIAGEAPYGSLDKNGNVVGEAPTVARAIFKNLGVPALKAEVVEFSALIPSLNVGDFDMIAAGMAILPDRCKKAMFSVPDYQAFVAFLVPEGNPRNVWNFEDVKRTGVKIAGEVGAVETKYAADSGVPSSQILTFEAPSQLLTAVTTGRVYAAALTDISLKWLARGQPSVEVTPEFTPPVEVGGFVFRKNETTLVHAFNAELTKLHRSGQWIELVEPFEFKPKNLPAASPTTAELCSGKR